MDEKYFYFSKILLHTFRLPEKSKRVKNVGRKFEKKVV